MDGKVIFRDVGWSLRYVGFLFFVPLFVAWFYGEQHAVLPFLWAGTFAWLLGNAFLHLIKYERDTNMSEGLVSVALVWILTALISSVPFQLIGKMSFLDAFFEAMSAWTTTGFTLVTPEFLPKTLVFWRSFMQWVGGLGIVILALVGMFRRGNVLYFAEGRSERIKPNIVNTVKSIGWIYLLYTSLVIGLLFYVGMPLFDSIIHAMSTLAAGGMSSHSAGPLYFDSPAILGVIIFSMILGGIGFFTHHNFLTGNWKIFWKDTQVLFLFAFIALGTIMLLPNEGMISSIFHTVSSITGTGYQLADLSMWAPSTLLTLIIFMVIGGSVGSAAGGIKISRFAVLLRSTYNTLLTTKRPHQIPPNKIGMFRYSQDDILSVYKFTTLYVVLLFICVFILVFSGHDLTLSLFHVASAQGNVGIGVFATLDTMTKIVTIFSMLLGRLEIWSVLMLFYYIVGKKF